MTNKKNKHILYTSIVILGITACNLTLDQVDATPPPPERPAITVDDVLTTCPTVDQINAINGAIDFQFDADPTAGTLVCTASDGSVNLTQLQERAYQAIIIMQRLQFNKPLPWTDQSLYNWFINAIDGIRFRDDITYSFCCEPDGYINVQTNNLSALETNQWISPNMGTGLDGLMVLYIHEARHNEVGGHTCEDDDTTIDELNAWGVQYYLYEWLAWNTTDPSFFYSDDTLGLGWHSYNLETAYYNSIDIANTRFCDEEPIEAGEPPKLP